ncbi:MAG: hypothetical protein WCW26_00975 [Candidatus Buchananbacteria bacterium]
MATNRFQDKISVSKIGTGGFFRAGSFDSRKKVGLAGALRSAKQAGKFSYAKNLSKKDLQTFQGLLGEELAKLPKHSAGLSYKTRARLMTKARGLMLSDKISRADMTDFRQIVKGLSAYPQKTQTVSSPTASTEPRQRAVNFATDSKTSQPTISTGSSLGQTRPMNPKIAAAINYDNMRELAEEEASGIDSMQKYYPQGSVLGQALNIKEPPKVNSTPSISAFAKPEPKDKEDDPELGDIDFD